MFLVVFRARVRKLDDEYARVAHRMRELALGEFGCVAFHSVTEGDEEVALSWWPDEATIAAWRSHPEHALAQAAGRERWYVSYSVDVAKVVRRYDGPAGR